MKVSDVVLRGVMLAGLIQATGGFPQLLGDYCAYDVYYDGCMACGCVGSQPLNWLSCTPTDCGGGSCSIIPAWWCYQQ